MPSFTADAIILNTIDFSESDKIVFTITKDHGIINAIAKGAKRSKKRFPGTLEPFCEVSLELFSRRGMDLQRIESATLRSAHLGIREDLFLLAHACVLIEIIKEHLGPLDPSPATYECLRSALTEMEKAKQWFAIWVISMMNILKTLGYEIDLKGYVKKRNGVETITAIETLSPEALMFLVKGLDLDMEVLNKLCVSPRARREITRYLLIVCNRVSEKGLKTTQFLAKLLDLDMIQ